MRHLNRKEYKKVIKEFRKTCPIAQVNHKWVYVKDEYQRPHLIYVYGSVIKRVNKNKELYGYRYGNYRFKILLYGLQSMTWDMWEGIKIQHCYSYVTVFNNINSFRILPTTQEVSEEYDRMFEIARKYHKHQFIKEDII